MRYIGLILALKSNCPYRFCQVRPGGENMKYRTLFIALFLSLSVQAKTIIISDIDDTLKNSHVLSTQDKIKKAIFTHDMFLGINWVLQQLSTGNPEFRFFYVSNALADLMIELHQDFIIGNKFPTGKIYLKDMPFVSEFKIKKMREILNEEKPDQVIAIGDNGEIDTLVYEQLRAEYPLVVFTTYIHLAYFSRAEDEAGKALVPGQIGFATSLDLLLHFYNQKLVPTVYMNSFLNSFAGKYLAQKKGDVRLAIPRWMDCRDFSWSVNDSVFANEAKFLVVKEKILQRCSRPPFGND